MNKKQICQFLTYDYSNYEARELIYNQIIDQFDESLKPDLKINNEPDESRSLDLGEKGICKMPKIDLSICTYLKNQYFPKESRSFEQKRSISPSILINDSILMQIFCDKRLIRPIQRYLGIFPSIQFIASWENQGGNKPKRTNEMYWHMDHHGHKFVKVFYYLDAVEMGIGHHQFITNTHNQARFDKLLDNMQSCSKYLREVISNKRKLRGGYKIDDDAIWPISKSIVDVIGDIGTGFAEDTRGLHRGTPLPPNTHRRIIQCLYLPFSNGKDESLSLRSGKKTSEVVQKNNRYTDVETQKLFDLINC